MDDKLALYIEQVFKGARIPEDLKALYKMQASRIEKPDEYVDPLEALGVNLLEYREQPPLLSFSYLNDDDFADPGTMAGVDSTKEMFQWITFVAENGNGDLVGYWHGPEQISILEAPIVRYDTEGQFSISPGDTMTEALVANWFWNDTENYLKMKKWFAEYGLEVRGDNGMDVPFPEPATNPVSLSDKLFKRHAAERGVEVP